MDDYAGSQGLLEEEVSDIEFMMSTIEDSFPCRSKDFMLPVGRFYVRRKYFSGKKTFVIASVTIKNKGKGVFTRLLEEMEQVAPRFGYEQLYVENIVNPRFLDYLLDRDFNEADSPDGMSFNVVKEL